MNKEQFDQLKEKVDREFEESLDEMAKKFENALMHQFGPAERVNKAVMQHSPSDTPKNGISPKATYGVAPTAPIACEDDEYQQLNLAGSANPFSAANGHGAYEWIDGEDDKGEHDYDTPKLSRPTSPGFPAILKSLIDVLEKSIGTLPLNLNEELSARAVLADLHSDTLNLSWTPSIKSPGIGDYIFWPSSETFSDVTHVSMTSLLSTLRKYSKDEGLNQELGTLASKTITSPPISLVEAVERTDKILKAAAILGVELVESLNKAWRDSSDGDHVGKLVEARLQMLKAAEAMEGKTHPSVTSAMTSLADDTLNLIEGLRMGNVMRYNSEPEHEIIKEAGADSIYNDVERSDRLIEKVSKADTIVEEEVESADDINPPHEGMMIAWYPTSGFAAQLSSEGGETAENIHMTLIYFGKADDYSDEQINQISEIMSKQVKMQQPIQGQISGFAVFNEEEGKVPVVALIDAAGLAEFRTIIIKALDEESIPFDKKHDFTPHITLAYGDPSGANLLNRDIPYKETTPLSIDSFWLVKHDDKIAQFSLDGGIGDPSGQEPIDIEDRLRASDEDAKGTATLFNKMWRRQIVDSRYGLQLIKTEGGKNTVIDVE